MIPATSPTAAASWAIDATAPLAEPAPALSILAPPQIVMAEGARLPEAYAGPVEEFQPEGVISVAPAAIAAEQLLVLPEVTPAGLLPTLPLAAADALEVGGEAFEALGELLYAAGPADHNHATPVTWWESSATETLSEPDTFTEYTLDSEDTSVSSTRAPTNATEGSGSASRISRGSRRGFSVGVRGARSPVGYRGRSVTRRERQVGGAALRHRHPTHTPSRGPNPRGGLTQVLGPAGFNIPAHLGVLGVATGSSGRVAGHGHLIEPQASRFSVPHRRGFHQIGRVREEPAEVGGL
mmetsp:Transcript_137492/g.343023  ORF Transcript_137492/g.343023 Transcript_137492/m.343023 type:complete len:296 (-) Transcript_137492:74-961(-)